MKVELPYVIEKVGVKNVSYYALLIGLGLTSKQAYPTKEEAVKDLEEVVRETSAFWISSYKKRDEAGKSLPGK